VHRRGTLWVGGRIAMTGSSNNIPANLPTRHMRDAR
jgi:hypothetical protein